MDCTWFLQLSLLLRLSAGLLFRGACSLFSLSTFFSWNLGVSAGIWKSWFVIPIIFFVVFITTIKNSEQIKKVFYSLILSGVIISLISLVYLIQGNLADEERLQGIYAGLAWGDDTSKARLAQQATLDKNCRCRREAAATSDRFSGVSMPRGAGRMIILRCDYYLMAASGDRHRHYLESGERSKVLDLRDTTHQT